MEALVEAEGEFVEIGLQVLRTDAVMDAAKPGFEIGEHEGNDGQKGFRDLHKRGVRIFRWTSGLGSMRNERGFDAEQGPNNRKRSLTIFMHCRMWPLFILKTAVKP